ncbi:hypothetical protein QQ054_18585 [Oscillatoria amoena NRMC-F 0135]|nr:hypothetical protein [Oscillatoria amoena NRMC-F 0135]
MVQNMGDTFRRKRDGQRREELVFLWDGGPLPSSYSGLFHGFHARGPFA